MRHPILAVSGAMFVAVVLASAGNRVDSIAGDGTARQSVEFGTDTAAGYVGEVLAVPGKVMAEARPHLQNMAAQAGSTLGGVAQDPPATADPSDSTGDLNGGGK